ncbi:MAG: serine hydrolase domain-containing protein [Bacteroidota bacterium]
MNKIVISFFFLISLFSSAISQELTVEQRIAIEKYLQKQIKPGAPGLAAGIILNGEVVYESYLGLASLQHQVPIDQNSRFNIASVAKQFTALCALQLILDGKMSLEDDVRKYLPNMYPEVEEPIKIKHMLNHSSGIRDFYDLMSIQQDPWWRQEGLDNDDAIELLEKQNDLNFKPGSDYLYSNSNYTLLTKIIAEVSGESFHDYAKSLFESLGMKNTSFLKDYMHVIPNIAYPYSDWGDGVWQQYPMLTNLYGDGFLFTTLRDQLHFEMAIQNAEKEGNQLLTVSQNPIANAQTNTYGYGLELEDRLDYKAVHHSGGTGSYHAQIARYPDQKLSVVVMSNNGTIRSGYIADELASVVLPEKDQKDDKITLDTRAYASERSIESILGEYKNDDGAIVRITNSEGDLFWKRANNNPIKLIKDSGSIYVAEQNTKIRIGFDSDGLTLANPGAELRFYKKLVPFSPTKNYLNAVTGKYYSRSVDVGFTITLNKDSQLVFHQDDASKSSTIEVIQRDAFLLYDYQIIPEYDETDHVQSLMISFNRIKDLKFKKIETGKWDRVKFTEDGGYIQVSTTSENYGKGNGDVLLTKNLANDNEEWVKLFGGKAYDKAHSIELAKDGGFLLVGSTSSYGNGNYDVWVIKTDVHGKEEWSKTFGGEYNEYGYYAKEMDNGIWRIRGSKQDCPNGINGNCQTSDWLFEIDPGNLN